MPENFKPEMKTGSAMPSQGEEISVKAQAPKLKREEIEEEAPPPKEEEVEEEAPPPKEEEVEEEAPAPKKEEAAEEPLPMPDEEEISLENGEEEEPIPVGKLYEEPIFDDKQEEPEKQTKSEEAAEWEKEETQKTDESQVEEGEVVEEKKPAEELPEKEDLSGGYVGLAEKAAGNIANAFHNIGSFFNAKIIVTVLILAAIAAGGYYAYTQKVHESVYNYVAGFFSPKTEEKIEVTVNEDDLKSFGIITAGIFASNTGSVNDVVPAQIRMADFFGNLLEPRVQGETGITAATFYGALQDQKAIVNQFVLYIEYLAKIQNLYKIDVYAMLDRTSERSAALLDYIDKLKNARTEGQTLLAQIKINMDEFTVSFNSLNEDKTKDETDFFTAMAALEADKSDQLLKGFVDASQKQVALKARINALSKLVTYYETALAKLDTRILAVDENQQALVQGIRVVDVPGAGLGIIIQPETGTKK
jgi:hypothetical protein